MRVESPHPWDVTPAEARAIQAEFAPSVSLDDGIRFEDIRVVAGVDNGYATDGNQTIGHAAVVVFSFPGLEPVETAHGTAPVAFPYVPGLLSFREAPAILAAFGTLRTVPDVLLFDGQGYAHPRRFGLASHLGVVLGVPSIGCAKSRLVGTFEEPAREFGAQTPLVHGGETVGAAVRTRPCRAPLFVSPGHRVSVDTAVRLVLACCRDGAFLPVPTAAAHDAVSERTGAARERAREA